jgi:hypothetical protein
MVIKPPELASSNNYDRIFGKGGRESEWSTSSTKPGERNTDDVIAAVARRMNEGGIEAVVVASASGRTIPSLKVGFSVL